jgi:hypothetical protein
VAGVWRASWRWFTPSVIFLVFFCIAWDSFLIFWYSMAFNSKHVPWIAVVAYLQQQLEKRLNIRPSPVTPI